MMPEFKALWNRINSKSVYVVDFDTDELVRKSIDTLDTKLKVSKIYFKVETGSIDNIEFKDVLASGEAFVKKSSSYGTQNKIAVNTSVKYDLVGKLVDATGLTRKAIIQILTGIKKPVFDQFKDNPEEFIIQAGNLINEEKANAIIQHITYDVAVYVKLPSGFYISTPVGHYNSDWAIAFYEENIKHIYFVAETKGSMRSMELRQIEIAKRDCAKEHFMAISNGNVKYEVVDSFKKLLEKVMK